VSKVHLWTGLGNCVILGILLLTALTLLSPELDAYIFQEYISSRYTCSSNEIDLSYAFSVLKELNNCYAIWEQRTVLQSVEMSLMSAKDRLLHCSYHEVTNPVGEGHTSLDEGVICFRNVLQT